MLAAGHDDDDDDIYIYIYIYRERDRESITELTLSTFPSFNS